MPPTGPDPTVRLGWLADHPEAIDPLAQWHHQAWGALAPDWSLTEAKAELAGHQERQAIPTTIVGFKGVTLVGSASLLLEDMPDTAAWTPWLASVFVAPEWRGRGIGGLLVERAVAEASWLGVRVLHLFTTEAEGWYAPRGWEVRQRRPYRGRVATIMDLDLSRQRATFQITQPSPTLAVRR